MSKLGDAIKAVNTHKQMPQYLPLSFTKVNEAVSSHATWPTLYQIGATFQVDRVMESDDTAALEQAIAAARRMILEEIFGEFRKPIMDIRADLFMRDTEAATAKLNALYRSMFE